MTSSYPIEMIDADLVEDEAVSAELYYLNVTLGGVCMFNVMCNISPFPEILCTLQMASASYANQDDFYFYIFS